MTGLLAVNLTWLVTAVSGDPARRSRPPGSGPPTAREDGAQDAGPLPVDQEFDGGSLHAVRAAAAAAATQAGLPRERVYDVVAAVHELATNTVRHGGGRGRLRMWSDQGMLHCQVSDGGTPADVRRQDGEPPWTSEPGHGLWLARQVADHASIACGPDGTTATVRFTAQPPRQPTDQPH
jgi:anti-sigma regulatory factor (Ser/Thr protein kinase)